MQQNNPTHPQRRDPTPLHCLLFCGVQASSDGLGQVAAASIPPFLTDRFCCSALSCRRFFFRRATSSPQPGLAMASLGKDGDGEREVLRFDACLSGAVHTDNDLMMNNPEQPRDSPDSLTGKTPVIFGAVLTVLTVRATARVMNSITIQTPPNSQSSTPTPN